MNNKPVVTVEDIQPKHSHRHRGSDFSALSRLFHHETILKVEGVSGSYLLAAAQPVSFIHLHTNDIISASYDQYNSGVYIMRFNYFVVEEKDGTVSKFGNWKAVKEFTGCSALRKMRAAGYEVRMHVTDLDADEEYVKTYGEPEGDWFYEFEGTFCRGSGAEKLSFYSLVSLEDFEKLQTQQAAKQLRETLTRDLENTRKQIENLKLKATQLENELKGIL